MAKPSPSVGSGLRREREHTICQDLQRNLLSGALLDSWDTHHCLWELLEEPPRNRLSFTKTRFIEIETFLWPPSSQFKTGLLNQPRQTVLMFCDFVGTTSFCFIFLPQKPQAPRTIFALKCTSHEPKPHCESYCPSM